MPVYTPTEAQLDRLLELCGGEQGEVAKLLAVEGGLNKANLRRWFIARKGDLNVAAKDIKAHAEWRKSFMPNVSPVSFQMRQMHS